MNFGYLAKGNELRIDRCKTVIARIHAQLCPLAVLLVFTKVRIIFRRYNFSLKDGDEDAEDEAEFPEDEDAEDENAQDEEDEEQEEYPEDEDIPEDEVAKADEESDPLTGIKAVSLTPLPVDCKILFFLTNDEYFEKSKIVLLIMILIFLSSPWNSFWKIL